MNINIQNIYEFPDYPPNGLTIYKREKWTDYLTNNLGAVVGFGSCTVIYEYYSYDNILIHSKEVIEDFRTRSEAFEEMRRYYSH